MSKGEQLRILLDESEATHAEMEQLFIKNGIPQLDISSLPEREFDKWQKLKSLNDSIAKKMSDLLNGK